MMAAWMAYAVVAAAVLCGVGLLAERGLAAMGRPGRWVWVAVIAASAAWPFVVGALPAAVERDSGSTMASGAPPGVSESAGPVVLPAGSTGGPADAVLFGVWCIASLVVLLALAVSAGSLSGERRRCSRGTVAGEPVLISGGLGPAVAGSVRPWIVLPAWVLELDESLQRLIVLHEREHVRAGDNRLLVAGLVALVILPWCVPLWWQFHRLRLAIELDCDARVLRSGAPARAYAEVLLAVARRRRRVVIPLAALAPSRAALERRLRRIVAAPVRGRGRAAFAPVAASVLILAVGAAAVPAPTAPALSTVAGRLLAEREIEPRGTVEPVPADRLRRGEHRGPLPGPLPDGSLPGDPGEAALVEAIRTHHGGTLGSGLPAGSVIWFIADREGGVARTGIEQGTVREVEVRVRQRYPAETSHLVLAFEGVPAGAGEASVVWLLPEP